MTDRVREALFSALESVGGIEDAHVLDLYAGSGALGFEALSRGASTALLVEANRRAASVIRRNDTALGLRGGEVRGGAVETVLRERPGREYDLVLADPPYALPEDDLARVLALLVERGWLAAGAMVIVEREAESGPPSWPSCLVPIREKAYGQTRLYWARYDSAAGPDR